jgi:hypothetical protein
VVVGVASLIAWNAYRERRWENADQNVAVLDLRTPVVTRAPGSASVVAHRETKGTKRPHKVER